MVSEAEVRAISHELLGNAYLLDVAAAIAEFSDGLFHQQLICRKLTLNTSAVRPALQRLERGGLIKRRPRTGLEQEFEAIPSVYWELCTRLRNEVGGP